MAGTGFRLTEIATMWDIGVMDSEADSGNDHVVLQWRENWAMDVRNTRRLMLCAVLVHPSRRTAGSDGPMAGGETDLAMIDQRFLSSKITGLKAFHQGLFWETVREKIERMCLEPAVRKALEAEISRKVPRPAPDWALWAVTCIPRFDR